MRRFSLLAGILAIYGGELQAHLKVYSLSLPTPATVISTALNVLPDGTVLLSAYDTSYSAMAFLKVEPVVSSVTACGVDDPFPTRPFYLSLKVRDGRLVSTSAGGVLLADTALDTILRIGVGTGADADIVAGDTLLLVWGDSLSITLGYVSSGSFSPIQTLRLSSVRPDSLYYAVRTYYGGAVVAHASGDTLMLTYVSTFGGTLTYDSTVAFVLPPSLDLVPSALRLAWLPSERLLLGFTVGDGVRTYPAFLIRGIEDSAFVMDSSGILSDIRPAQGGILVVSKGPSSFAQLVASGTPDTSLEGVRYPDIAEGGTEFSVGHYVLSGHTSLGAITLIYSDFYPTDTVVVRDVRTWSPLSLTKTTVPLTTTPASVSMTSSLVSCSPVTVSASAIAADDTIPPILTSYPSDTVIKSQDTLVFGFSEEMDPETFRYGTRVEAYGSLKFPVATHSFCTGTYCYLIVRAPGADSLVVSLTAFITDTAGVPLAPGSRISLSFSVLPERPRILFTQPDSGEIDVPLNANVGVWFSTGIDSTTVNSYTVDISDGTVTYPFTVSCSLPNMCVLDPIGDFPPATRIAVSFTAGIRDTFGQPIFPKVITFRTVEEDTLAPRVAMTVPDSGDIGVPRNFALSVLFTKPMDTTTVAGGVSLLGSSSGAHTFNVFCPTLKNCVIRPLSSFMASEVVTVRFNSSIRDTFNRSLVPKTVIFQVGSTFDNVPPNVSVIAPPNDTIVLYHPILSPLKAAVWDNSGILMASWLIGSEAHHAPLSCRDLPYVASDTTCLDVSTLPSDTYRVRAIAYDLANTQSVDSVVLIVRDTVRPRVSFTEPANGEVSVSPYTHVSVTFTELMDTLHFPDSAVSVSINSSPVPFSHTWNTPYTLRLTFPCLGTPSWWSP